LRGIDITENAKIEPEDSTAHVRSHKDKATDDIIAESMASHVARAKVSKALEKALKKNEEPYQNSSSWGSGVRRPFSNTIFQVSTT
jgi:hypothetical protein